MITIILFGWFDFSPSSLVPSSCRNKLYCRYSPSIPSFPTANSKTTIARRAGARKPIARIFVHVVNNAIVRVPSHTVNFADRYRRDRARSCAMIIAVYLRQWLRVAPRNRRWNIDSFPSQKKIYIYNAPLSPSFKISVLTISPLSIVHPRRCSSPHKDIVPTIFYLESRFL